MDRTLGIAGIVTGDYSVFFSAVRIGPYRCRVAMRPAGGGNCVHESNLTSAAAGRLREKGRLLTTLRAAALLGVAPRTVRLWAECGYLPAFKIGKQWRFDEQRLQSWMESNNNSSLNSPLLMPFSRRQAS